MLTSHFYFYILGLKKSQWVPNQSGQNLLCVFGVVRRPGVRGEGFGSHLVDVSGNLPLEEKGCKVWKKNIKSWK